MTSPESDEKRVYNAHACVYVCVRVMSLQCPKAFLKCITHNLKSQVSSTQHTGVFPQIEIEN